MRDASWVGVGVSCSHGRRAPSGRTTVDQPNGRKTIEMAALAAPATITGISAADGIIGNGSGPGSSSWDSFPAATRSAWLRRGMLEEPLLDVGTAVSGGGEELGVLGPEHDTAGGVLDAEVGAGAREGVRDVPEHRLRALGVPVVDVLAVADEHRRDRVHPGSTPPATLNGSHGESSSCSPMHRVHRPGRPGWPVPAPAGGCRSRCGRSGRAPGRWWRWPGSQGRRRRPRS